MTDPILVVRAVPWDDAAGEALRVAQRDELTVRYETPDSEPGPAPTGDDILVFLVAYRDGVAVGCGGLRGIDDEHGEIKRMYVDPASRGTGVSTAVLRALEGEAVARGWNRLVLETGDRQPDAIRFYTREGYRPIPLFGYYVGSELSLCFGKTL